MEEHTFRFNLNRPFGDFQRAMQRSLDLVAFGLLAHKAEVEEIELPVFPSRYVGSRIPAETLRAEFSSWLIGHGLNDCVEALEPLLLEVWRGCHLGRAQRGTVSAEYLENITSSHKADKFSRLAVGAKIKEFRRKFPEILSAEWENILDALNKLRVCLTHAGGVIRQKDCTRENCLEVDLLWRQFVFVDSEGNEHLVTKGMRTEDEGHLGMKMIRAPKAVHLGERLTIGPEELLGICETLLRFATELRQGVVEDFKKQGLLPENFTLDPPKFHLHVLLGPPEQSDLGASASE